MSVSRSEVSCRDSIQREIFVTDANAISSSRAGREAVLPWLLINRSRCSAGLLPGNIGSQRVAGATLDSSASCRGPVRRSYTDARVRRHVDAAMALGIRHGKLHQFLTFDE